MLEALTLILVCQLAGEVTTRAFGLPVPGPVLGMLLLLAWLWFKGGVSDEVGRTADALLGNLSLLFVPAGVGIMVHWDKVQAQWLAITAALVFGTLVTILVTALTMAGVQRWLAWRRGSGDV